MTRRWMAGVLTRGWPRLVAAASGVAVAVALLASLGIFLAASKATMTANATAGVAVDWQVQVTPGSDPAAVAAVVQRSTGVAAELPVGAAQTSGFTATVGGTTQTTGPGVVLGLPPSYRTTFPGEIRTLVGSADGVLLAQQTAANLHVAPGDSVRVSWNGAAPSTVRIAGIVDLPQADSLFQKVGAPPQSQPIAPPDNVLIVPTSTFQTMTGPLRSSRPDLLSDQIHVRRTRDLPPDPVTAFTEVTASAHNLEAALAGAGQVGDNLGAALDAARKDALYAQVLFLFLGVPGAVLAALLTGAVVAAGRPRQRREQALLRARGASLHQLVRLAAAQTAVIAVAGSLAGLGLAVLVGHWAFGSTSFGATTSQAVLWSVTAGLAGCVVAGLAVLVPAVRDARSASVMAGRQTLVRSRGPWWMRYGVDLVLLLCAGLVFLASSGDSYSLVLAPEGVASISVSYWAFAGPALLWVGAGLVAWRVSYWGLGHLRPVLAVLLRPLAGRLAGTATAGISRQRALVARGIVLVALALSFAGSTAAFNSTYRQQAEVDAVLTNGADISVTQAPGAAVSADTAQTLRAVAGVVSVEPLLHRYAYVGSDLQDLYGVDPASITRTSSLQDAYFDGGTASQLMARLAAQPDAVLVSDETVHDFQLALGDLLRLRLMDGRTQQYVIVPFHYVGVVKEFPTAPRDSFFVANADYVASATGSAAVGTYLVSTGGTDVRQVADAVLAKVGTSAVVSDITQVRSTIGSSLTSVDLAGLTRVELLFAVLLSAAAGGLVLALGLAERRRGFAIVSVLGATGRQLRGLVLGEAAVVAVGGVLAGALAGWCLSIALIKVLTGVFDPPPESLAVPWLYLAAVVAATIVAIAGAAVAVAAVRRRPPVEVLRAV
jgi:putative ABC transport system permease protein